VYQRIVTIPGTYIKIKKLVALAAGMRCNNVILWTVNNAVNIIEVRKYHTETAKSLSL